MRKHIHRFITAGAAALLLAIGVAGCQDAETMSVADPAAEAGVEVPTLAQIQSAVTLTEDQTSTVKAALATWRDARAQRGSADERDERVGPMSGHGPRALAIDFVADVAPSLSTQQLSSLIAVLAEHRAEKMKAAGDRREGRRWRRGMRPGGPGNDLGLSEEQREAMRAARKDLHEQMCALHERFTEGAITEDELHEQAKALRDAFRETIAGILTEEQLAQMEAHRSDRIERRIERQLEHLGDHLDRRIDRMTRILDLTTDQMEQIRSIIEATLPEVEAVLEAVLSGDLTPDAGFEQLRSIRGATRDAIRELLTEAQRERMDAVRPLMGPRHCR